MAGPRRSKSINSYLWETRAIAVAAVLALIAGIVSDIVERRFWDRHALLTGLASSVIIVMLTVALVNEAVERRRRQRWNVLAQYVMLQLVRDARGIWTGLLELAGLMPAARSSQGSPRGGRAHGDPQRSGVGTVGRGDAQHRPLCRVDRPARRACE